MMLEDRHSEREGSVNSNHAIWPENMNSNLLENNEENLYLNPRTLSYAGDNADIAHNSTSANSSAEMSKEMNEMMNSVSIQIQGSKGS